jgi:magnesium-transporting ATPase (P-type)
VNTKNLPKLKSYRELLWDQLQETTIKIMFVAGVVSLVIGWFNELEPTAWYEGVSIIAACLFITVLSSLCNWGKEKQYLKLHDEILNEEVSVIRGQYGLSQQSKVTDIVVGDVILIEAGMRVPADCLLIDGMDITCDESKYDPSNVSMKKAHSLGEEHHLSNPDPLLLTQSLVRTGSGRAVVCAVGKHTRWFT